MGRSCVTKFVNSLNSCITGCIKSDDALGAREVVINGTRQSDGRNPIFFKQKMRAGKSTVPSNHHQSINTVLFQVFIGFFPSLGRSKSRTSRRSQKGPPSFQYISNVFCL